MESLWAALVEARPHATRCHSTASGRWCADSARWASSGRHVAHREALLRGSKTDPQRPLPTDPLTTDSVRRRPTKLSHLIEDVTCEDGLRLLPRPTARSKALPDDQLVPEEGVLHTGLLIVARVLLPLSSSSLLHLSDRAIARARPHDPTGAAGRTATVEEGLGLPSAGPCGERLLPVQVDHRGEPSSAPSGGARD